MRRSALILLVAVVGMAQLSLAQTSRRVDGVALGESLREFLAEVRTNVQRDVAIWSERAQKMRKQIVDRINSDDELNRRRLLGDSVIDALSKGWELILDAGGAVKSVLDAKKLKVSEFFADMLGKNWSDYTPISWHDGSFNWDKLGAFEFSSSFSEFLTHDSILTFNKSASLADMYDKMDTLTDALCTAEKHQKPEKIATTCYGPMVNITFVPKTCIIEGKEKKVICDPAKLVLTKIPGSCVLKHYTAFAWKAKECRLTGHVGFDSTKILGGENYTVDLGELNLDKVKDIWHLDDTENV